MKRVAQLLGVLVFVALLCIAAALVFVATADWNRFTPMLNERVSKALGRPFAIDGALSVRLGPDAAGPSGWHRLLPWIHVSADKLSIGNPDWSSAPRFAVFGRVSARVALLPLFRRAFVIPRIEVHQPEIFLERLGDGRANWTFDRDEATPGAARWALDLGEIGFDRGRLGVADAVLDAQFEVVLDPLGEAIAFRDIVGGGDPRPPDRARDVPQDYAFGWQADGRYRGQPFTGRGRIGGLLALHAAGGPFPLEVTLEVGATRIEVAGTLTDPRALAALDLRLSLSGANLSDLYPLTGLTLPDTDDYATTGRLRAELREPGGAVYRYENFNGRIGESDIRGRLVYMAAEPRPRLEGELRSRQLRLADLAPLIGADYAEPPADAAEQPPEDRVLPVARFRTERWRDMDADVRLVGQHVDRGEQLPITDLDAHLSLTDGGLSLAPLRLGIAGGRVEGTVHLDGRASPMQGRARLQARRLALQQLFPGFEPMQTSLGELNGDVALDGTGNSVAALLASADGEFRLLIVDGAISRGLMEIAGLNVGSYIVSQLFGDDEVRINCALADVGVQDGVLDPRLVVFDTENARVDVTGTASLADEELDLLIRPRSKGVRILSLRSPLYVRGTFKEPAAGVQAGPLIARGAGLLALGTAVAPVAGLLALVAPGAESGNPCVVLLEHLERGSDAPAAPR